MLIAATSPLLLLAVLACPIGMGLMMFFMGRGMMGGMKHNDRDAGTDSLAEMKAEQARLAEKIDTLEEQQSQPPQAASERERDRVS